MKIDKKLVHAFIMQWNKRIPENKLTWIDINSGRCYQFALVVQFLYGGELRSTCNHAWVNIDGIDYDAWNLNGTNIDPGVYCPIFRSVGVFCDVCDELGCGQTDILPQDFIEFWDEFGGSGPVEDLVIQATIDSYLRINDAKTA